MGKRGRGRPQTLEANTRRGVTLLDRHWQWLEQHPGGISATLRRLIETAIALEAAATTATVTRPVQALPAPKSAPATLESWTLNPKRQARAKTTQKPPKSKQTDPLEGLDLDLLPPDLAKELRHPSRCRRNKAISEARIAGYIE